MEVSAPLRFMAMRGVRGMLEGECQYCFYNQLTARYRRLWTVVSNPGQYFFQTSSRKPTGPLRVLFVVTALHAGVLANLRPLSFLVISSMSRLRNEFKVYLYLLLSFGTIIDSLDSAGCCDPVRNKASRTSCRRYLHFLH